MTAAAAAEPEATPPETLRSGVSGYFYDLSYDGQTYHQEGILRMVDGVVPLPQKPGLGIELDPGAMARYCVARMPA